jgi:signal peptidase II
MSRGKRKTLMWILFLLVLVLDRLTKYLVIKNIPLNQSLPVIKNFFHISLVHNTGAAFGLLRNQNYLFMAVSLLAIILIAIHLKTGRGLNKIFALSLVLILAGTIGNLIDRLFFGYVIDFLDFRVWPVFNFADSSITIGAILLGYCLLKNPVAKKY